MAETIAAKGQPARPKSMEHFSTGCVRAGGQLGRQPERHRPHGAGGPRFGPRSCRRRSTPPRRRPNRWSGAGSSGCWRRSPAGGAAAAWRARAARAQAGVGGAAAHHAHDQRPARPFVHSRGRRAGNSLQDNIAGLLAQYATHAGLGAPTELRRIRWATVQSGSRAAPPTPPQRRERARRRRWRTTLTEIHAGASAMTQHLEHSRGVERRRRAVLARQG